ncbi:hypothetical protein IE81DRAFT_13543 [Ceraceosorus guamensis]|uniref:Uncharacterized protein n=1 Tax=Ceraceosorus guamensis TaxID=1522189 RepID=A0A316VQQ8_9BASI|nr:hypothetical protein IE81DRAFT_13543 [Ceraceosorus guamensis]PWN39670.1 hypothetical protein IE81DRAFT_13543 [Ceraceosorus guamensis]
MRLIFHICIYYGQSLNRDLLAFLLSPQTHTAHTCSRTQPRSAPRSPQPHSLHSPRLFRARATHPSSQNSSTQNRISAKRRTSHPTCSLSFSSHISSTRTLGLLSTYLLLHVRTPMLSSRGVCERIGCGCGGQDGLHSFVVRST